MLAKMVENIPNSNTTCSFPISYSLYHLFHGTFLKETLNNNAIPSKVITIIESINENIIDIKDKISIAIPNPIQQIETC